MDPLEFISGLDTPVGFEVSASQAKSAVEERELFLGLVTHPGWARIVEVAEAQIKNRRDLLEMPGDRTEDGRQAEFLKGEIMGLRTLIALPQVLVDNNEAMIEAYRRKHDGEDEGRE